MTKEHILSEVRRTAAENGGAALGVLRFATETGIRERDWRGRYWVRWSDALREAGLGANKWTSAIPDDELFGKLAAFVRELGRFPVESELTLRRRSDPTFPSHGAFRRIGGKAALADAVRRHCLARGEDDVAELCVAEARGRAAADDESAPDAQHGFVYLMKSGRHYTIGRTNAVGRRQYEHDRKLPEGAKLVHEIKTDDPVGIESYWHRRFAERRGRGEWFELTAADLAAFRRRKFM